MLRRNKRRKEKFLDRILEVPKEIATNEPKITVSGFKQMLVENYKVILEYQDIYIRIKTYTGIINVNGFNLKLGEMTEDDIMISRRHRNNRLRENRKQLVIILNLNIIKENLYILSNFIVTLGRS